MKRRILPSLVVAAVSAVAVSMSLTSCNNSSEDTASTTTYAMRQVDNTHDAIRRCNRQPGSGVLMSFDDFGTPEQVQAILDKLGEHRMRAAFFPTGKWAIENYDLILRMRAEGHILGNHTHTHANLEELSNNDESAFYGEIYPVEGMINTVPQLLRPPYEAGAYDARVGERLSERGVQICTWTADTKDWQGGDVNQMMQPLRDGDGHLPPLGPDGVILAHMHLPHTPALIDAVVQYLNEQGWAYERTT